MTTTDVNRVHRLELQLAQAQARIRELEEQVVHPMRTLTVCPHCGESSVVEP